MAIRTAATYAADGCLLKPVLLTFLQSQKIDFDFRLSSTWTRSRGPDGWFHASAHPSLNTEELIAYLQGRGEKFEPNYVATMSTIFGTVFHTIVEAALDYMKVAVPLPEGLCVACGLPRKGKISCREHGAVDHVLRSRGHLDAIGDFGVQGTHGIDLKTITPWGKYGLKEAPDMDLGFFMERWPKYYAQGQDYMRMTGLRRFIVLFLSMGNPWELREYQFPFDEVFAYGIEQRYRQARMLAA
jgi:hypothetical protein